MKAATKPALALAALTLAGTLLLHPSLERSDNRWLLRINEVPFDVVGLLQEKWSALTVDCSRIRDNTLDAMAIERASQRLRVYSPPDSESVRLTRLLGLENWWLVEAEFDVLPPAIVLMQAEGNFDLRITAIWSGTTFPWRTRSFAGEFLRARSPEAPRELTICAPLRTR